jgi:DNA-binding response OmpR family regulator
MVPVRVGPPIFLDAGPSRGFYKTFTTPLRLQTGNSLGLNMKALRRHMGLAQTASDSSYRYQDPHLELDFVRKCASLDSHHLVLTRKEYELLALLVENAGEIIPRAVLLMRVWGYSNEIRTRTLDVHVRRLRKKLGAYSEQYIETIFGIGYRFQPFRMNQRFAGSFQPIAMGA